MGQRGRWLTCAFMVPSMAVLPALTVHAAPAAPAAPPAPPAPASVAEVVMSPASEATEASSEARALRREVSLLRQRYIDEYRDRFSDDEVTKLLGYRSNADRQLASVVVTVNRLRNSTTGGVSAAQVRADAARALKAWKRAKATAESSWASARQIMEPRLSLFEKLEASNDYNAMMDRFDGLGDRIRDLG